MLLARAHYVQLVSLWLCFATPVVLLSSTLLLLGVPMVWVLFINWWFKPLYELPVLIYLSKAIFAQKTSIKSVLQESKSQIPRLLGSYLTLSRLSPNRSLTAPVAFLEQLKGKARRKRVSVLSAEITRAYTLMMAWINIEGIAYYVLLGVLLWILPFGYSISDMKSLLLGEVSDLGKVIGGITLLLPTLIAALVAPMYVGAGFLLYINRRMRLEAWDIEHQFQALESRHQQKTELGPTVSGLSMPLWAGLSALLIVLTSIAPSHQAYAQDKSVPRASDVRTEVQSVYEHSDFGSIKPVKKLRFIKSDDDDESKGPSNQLISTIFDFIVAASRVVIYIAAGAILALVIWALLRFSPTGWGFNRRPTLDALDVDHHPLTRSLPSDIAGHALTALNAGDFRESLSLLYRGALGTVMRRHELSIPASATENQCQRLVARCNNLTQTQGFNRITHKWSQTAYANQPPTHSEALELIEFWTSEFAHVDTTQPVEASA